MTDDDFDPHATTSEPDIDLDADTADAGRDETHTDLSTSMQEYVDAEVDRRIRAEIRTIADAAFTEALTPELFEQLRSATARTLAATLAARARAADQEAAAAESAVVVQVYPTLLAFVDAVIRPHYRRAVDSPEHNWCTQWWLHGEAFRRLDALWRAWEHLRKDPRTGMSVWWKDHADHHMGKLLDPSGTFAKCSVRHGHKDTLPTLPADAPHPALFGIPSDPSTTATATEGAS